MPGLLKLSLLNRYLAHKQHLLPGSRGGVLQVARDVVALQATAAGGGTGVAGGPAPEQGTLDALRLLRAVACT